MNCTGDETCKWCYPEPLTLEGDIRYLKAHIETKDRQLADANKRIEIYRKAWHEAEERAKRLQEENERLNRRVAEQNEWLIRLQQENKLLNTHKRRYQEEILQLEQEAETYRLALNKVRVITEEIGFE